MFIVIEAVKTIVWQSLKSLFFLHRDAEIMQQKQKKADEAGGATTSKSK